MYSLFPRYLSSAVFLLIVNIIFDLFLLVTGVLFVSLLTAGNDARTFTVDSLLICHMFSFATFQITVLNV